MATLIRDVLHERVEALADTGGLLHQFEEVRLRQVAEVVRDDELRFDFVERAARLAEELEPLARCPAALPLGDVRRHGNGCPAKLLRQAELFPPWKRLGNLIDLLSKADGRLPHTKISVRSHGLSDRRGAAIVWDTKYN